MDFSIDRQTIERAAKGDPPAVEAVVVHVWPQAYRIAAAIVRDADLAQDVAQDSCAAIVRGLPKLRSFDAFHGWWRRVVGNRALDATRRRPDHVSLESVDDVAIETGDGDAMDLYLAMRNLPVAQRAAVVLHYYGGLDSREIAAITGKRASTVRFHLMLARRTLHDALRASPDPSTPSLANTQETPHVR